jgi:hypothetical protein
VQLLGTQNNREVWRLNLFFFVWWDWGLNSGLHAYKQAFYHLATPPAPFFALIIFGDGGLADYLPGLALNYELPNLSLPSS